MSSDFRFILASSSPRRVQLLSTIGLKPDSIIPADIDETPYKNERPRLYSRRMAFEKAQKIVNQAPANSIILAADTVSALGRRILPKAVQRDIAANCLTKLSGRRHNVFTGVTVAVKYHNQLTSYKHRCGKTTVTFARMTPAQITWLLEAGDWEGKAGGYALQGFAARFIRWISGSPSNVIGLPLFETGQLLRGIEGNPFHL